MTTSIPPAGFNHNFVDRGDAGIEIEIQAKGLTAPRITLGDIEANIAEEHYLNAGCAIAHAEAKQSYETHVSLNLLSICILVLKNGFTVTGESACASPENFDAELGYKIARQNAVQKIWPLMGYELRSRLSEQAQFKVPDEV